ARAVKGDADDAVAAGAEVPRAGELQRGAAGEVDARGGEVLDGVRAVMEEARAHALHARKAERPEREVDKVDAEVDDAAAAGERGVVEPWLVGTVRVVEDEIGGVDLAERAAVDDLLHRAHRFGEAIRQVDAEEA